MGNIDVVAQWQDNSGYYRVETDMPRSVLSVFYAEDDTDPLRCTMVARPEYNVGSPALEALLDSMGTPDYEDWKQTDRLSTEIEFGDEGHYLTIIDGLAYETWMID